MLLTDQDHWQQFVHCGQKSRTLPDNQRRSLLQEKASVHAIVL